MLTEVKGEFEVCAHFLVAHSGRINHALLKVPISQTLHPAHKAKGALQM